MMTLNRAFDEAFAASPSSESDSTRVWVPSIDVVEKRDAYVVHADLPGVDRSSIEITFEKNILTISGKKPALIDGRSEEVRVFAAERVSGDFSRALRMPEYIDGDKIAAEYKDGLLTISVPKAELAQPRKIAVT